MTKERINLNCIQWLIDILRNPQTGNKFEYKEDTSLLIDIQSKQTYPVIHTIPVFLTEDITSAKSDLHRSLDSEFNYVEHYTKDAEAFDYFSRPANRSLQVEENIVRRQILRKIPKDANCILDVGCGSAWLSRELTKKGKKVISLDISLINTRKAIKQTPASNHAAVVADVFHLPFAENSIDCIVASEIMEHLYDPFLFIQKLLSILKPGGRLILSTPYNEQIEYSLCVHCNRITPRNAHLHSFNKKKMIQMTEKLKTKNVKIKIFNSTFLIKLRIHLLLSTISFEFWNLTDAVACKIFSDAFRIMTVIDK